MWFRYGVRGGSDRTDQLRSSGNFTHVAGDDVTVKMAHLDALRRSKAMPLRLGLLGLAVGAFGCAPTADEPPDMGEGSLTQKVLPCDVGNILAQKCHTCHGPVPGPGVPMSLTSWEAVQANSTSVGHEGKKIFQRISERIHDSNNPMPPRNPMFAQLTPEEIAYLDGWLAAGAPPGEACQPPPGAGGGTNVGGSGNTPGGGGVPGGGGYVGTGSGPGSGGSAGGGNTGGGGGGGGVVVVLEDGGVWDDTPVEPDPSECTMVELRANQNGAPYTIPSNEHYICFGVNIPEFAATKTQGLAFYSIYDAAQAPKVHHWLLYQSVTPQTNGTATECLGTHLDAALVAGWAPGATPWFLPKHVGVDLGPNYILEIHYNNPNPLQGPTTDDSGVKICTTTDLREETASVHWLGRDDIFFNIPAGVQDNPMPAKCTPPITEDLHILRTWPHMHKLGRRMTATMIRGGTGERIPYHDEIFDFNYQYQYNTPILMHPGDSIETVCYFSNDTGAPVGFGELTTQEMCYNFTVAYPANRLVNGRFSVHTNSCLNE